MATITDFQCVDELDQQILCDAFGNNVALLCPDCRHPVLAIARDNFTSSMAPNSFATHHGAHSI